MHWGALGPKAVTHRPCLQFDILNQFRKRLANCNYDNPPALGQQHCPAERGEGRQKTKKQGGW